MLEFEVVVTLPSDAQTALRVLYGDASFFSGYHARVGDASTSVSAWDAATRTRTVCFQKRMDIPAPIARVLGARPPALRSVLLTACAGRQLKRERSLRRAKRSGRLDARVRALTLLRVGWRAGDITALNVSDVQVFASAGERGAGATVTSTPNVGVKARGALPSRREARPGERGAGGARAALRGRCARRALTVCSLRLCLCALRL